MATKKDKIKTTGEVDMGHLINKITNTPKPIKKSKNVPDKTKNKQ